MSLVRFGEDGSDLYIYNDVDYGFYCSGCSLAESGFGGVPFGEDKNKLLLHVNEHIGSGHSVPEWLIDEIKSYNIEVD